jgi:hypothetical protein
MGRTLRRVVSSSLVAVVIFAVAGEAGAALTPKERARRAAGYIASQQNTDGSFPAFSPVGSTADAVLAFVAAGRGGGAARRALAYLKDQVAAGEVKATGQKAKVALAWAAAGRDPRDVAGKNLVRQLRRAYADTPSETVFDTALAVLSLRAADVKVPAAALALLLEGQCPDGGWSYDGFQAGEDEHCVSDPQSDWYGSDTNTTAYVTMALSNAPEIPQAEGTGSTPFDFFATLRDGEHGGWGYTWGYETTDANSTGLVLQAYAAWDLAPPAGARAALRGLQYRRCGAFAYTFEDGKRDVPDVGATIGAVPALLRMPFPYTGRVARPAPDTPACAA